MRTCFCIFACMHAKSKDADQLRGYRAADTYDHGNQRLCFHYIDNTVTLLPKSEISSL